MARFSAINRYPSLKAGDVIYDKGWTSCYRVVSAPFCRLHYCSWQGHLAAAPRDPHGYVMYLIQALGQNRIDRLLVRIDLA